MPYITVLSAAVPVDFTKKTHTPFEVRVSVFIERALPSVRSELRCRAPREGP